MKALFLTDTEEKATVLRHYVGDLADVTTVHRARHGLRGARYAVAMYDPAVFAQPHSLEVMLLLQTTGAQIERLETR